LLWILEFNETVPAQAFFSLWLLYLIQKSLSGGLKKKKQQQNKAKKTQPLVSFLLFAT